MPHPVQLINEPLHGLSCVEGPPLRSGNAKEKVGIGEDGAAAVYADEYVQNAVEVLLIFLEEVDDRLLLSDLK